MKAYTTDRIYTFTSGVDGEKCSTLAKGAFLVLDLIKRLKKRGMRNNAKVRITIEVL